MVSFEEATETAPTHKAGGKHINNIVMETEEKTENKTEPQTKVEEIDTRDKAVGKT